MKFDISQSKIFKLTSNLLIRMIYEIYNINLGVRKIILILLDFSILIFSFYIANWLTAYTSIIYAKYSIDMFLFLGFLSIFLYCLTGQYKGITRYVNSLNLYYISLRNIFILFIFYVFCLYYFSLNIEIKQLILIWILISSFTGLYRFIIRDILLWLKRNQSKETIIIYGAGPTGANLSSFIRLSNRQRILCFVDDDQKLWGRNINSISIYPPEKINQLTTRIDKVLLAMPSISNLRKKEILKSFKYNNFKVMQIPSIDEITSGKSVIDSLRPIKIEDILGRDVAFPDPKLLGPGISSFNICIIGAGGSIGSELCRQIMRLKPSSLILLDQSELNLYTIQKELNSLQSENISLKSFLGNAIDVQFIKKIFHEEKIDMVFHAAAYKHVPLVENNPLQGVHNNVFSTLSICQAVKESKSVKKMVFISTDKAVRPTNVMGASKRLAELVVQGFADEESKTSQDSAKRKSYTMVRFGNVLGSSGSVVPLFISQIEKGGPITLTHKNIKRFFMTITEAAQLVIQASVLAEGGELFHLNMGDEVRIYDLAVQMVNFSGLKIKDKYNPNGDIEIIYTGLRPGEKLYEELLIDGESEPTKHPLIYRSIEYSIDFNKLNDKLKIMKELILNHNKEKMFTLLKELVPEWTTNNNKVDLKTEN